MRALKLVGGSVAVYAVVAACSATTNVPRSPAAVGSPDGAVLDAPNMLSALADAAAAAVDAIVTPVPEAEAGPLPPDVAIEPCNGTTPAGIRYAEHAYPGKTVNDLSGVRVVFHLSPGSVTITGYDHLSGGAYLRDGYAAVNCGTSQNSFADTVTFVLPAP